MRKCIVVVPGDLAAFRNCHVSWIEVKPLAAANTVRHRHNRCLRRCRAIGVGSRRSAYRGCKDLFNSITCKPHAGTYCENYQNRGDDARHYIGLGWSRLQVIIENLFGGCQKISFCKIDNARLVNGLI